MKLILAIIACAASIAAAPAAAQEPPPGPVPYGLAAPPSEFEWGCFGACACPIITQSQIVGTFLLTRTHADPLFTYYDVTEVRWKVQSPTGPVAITGAGTYRLGGEFALTDQMMLDLAFGDGPVQHFDSGVHPVGASFPEIRSRLSLHGEGACFDTVLTVDAKPSGPLAVGGPLAQLSLVVGPNPTAGAAEVAFTLPRETTVHLVVHDLAGRAVRTLVERGRMPAGLYSRTWDGRRDDGAPAPVGLYLLQLETSGGRLTRSIVRVR